MKSTNTKTVLSPKRIDCKKLIAEVAKSPLLYNVDLPQYGDRCLKTRRWLDVTVAVTNNWDELDTHQKDERSIINDVHIYLAQ